MRGIQGLLVHRASAFRPPRQPALQPVSHCLPDRVGSRGAQAAVEFGVERLEVVPHVLPGAPVRFQARIDGQPPGAAHGADTDDAGNGTVAGPRLHQMIRQPGPVIDRTFAITFSYPGAQVYAFTFG